MTCGSCGSATPPTAKFCPECGAAQQPAAAARHLARKTVTIVFSDLVGSTPLGEELDAESLREVLDDYFDAMRRVIEDHGGLVEKYIGDAVMAVFGLPRVHEDDALRAVRAALGMRAALHDLNESMARSTGVRLSNRTGVNTGTVVVGDAIGGQRLATGDAVNVAARLEQAAGPDGIVLGPETRRLVKDRVVTSPLGLLTLKGKTDPIDAWGLVGLSSPAGQPTPPAPRRLVGREPQLATVGRCLETAARERCFVSAALVGEPGTGKSRLVREVVRRAEDSATVLSAACQPYGATSLSPLAELLGGGPEVGNRLTEQALRELTGGLSAEDQERVVARVASLLGLTNQSFPLEECFWATTRLLSGITPARRLLLVFEDLQWAGPTLLALLDHLRLKPRPGGAVVLSTIRADALQTPPLADVVAAGRMHLVHVSPLSEELSHELIEEALGGRLSEGVRAQLFAATGGNPLFLEQILAAWVEGGVLVDSPGGWQLSRPVGEVDMPASVSAAVGVRLDRLEDNERLVLQAVSVAAAGVDIDALPVMVGDLDRVELDEAVQRLVDARLLLRVATDDSVSLTLAHASLQEVAYDLTLKSDRATFHERLASWTAQRDDVTPADETIGHHLAMAYSYRRELRKLDTHALGLALRAAAHLVSECSRSLAIGDRPGADRTVVQIVTLLTGAGPEVCLTDPGTMERTAKLLVSMGRWRQAVELLSPMVAGATGPMMRDLGVALCQLHRSEPTSTPYREGQRLLEAAAAPPRLDPDALASLAGTWKGVDDRRAQALYRQCVGLDPSDPYPLGNVLEYEIAKAGHLGIVQELRSDVIQASLRCRAQADSGANLPWAFFDAGKLALLAGHPDDALAAYAKAVHLSTAEHMLATSMASLQRLERLGDDIAGWRSALTFLALARTVAFLTPEFSPDLGQPIPAHYLDEGTAVVLVAGGTDESAERWVTRHAETLTAAFKDVEALLISGGTDAGVAGLVGLLRERNPVTVKALGYLPAEVPGGARIDPRYDQLRRTAGSHFSIAESLQAWADLVRSGVQPGQVKLLAINGGEIARSEYRLALGLGCDVGVIVGSGREADRLLEDRDWLAVPNLHRIEPNEEAISRFLAA
jgi:class 3 adenylate cyclase